MLRLFDECTPADFAPRDAARAGEVQRLGDRADCHACLLGQDTVGRQPVSRLVAPLTDQLLDSRCKPLVKRSGHVRQLDLLNGGGAQWYSQYNMRNCTTSQKMPLWTSIK